MARKTQHRPIAANEETAQEIPEVLLWRTMIAECKKDLRKLKPSSQHYRSAHNFLFAKTPAFKEWRHQVFFMAKLNSEGIKP